MTVSHRVPTVSRTHSTTTVSRVPLYRGHGRGDTVVCLFHCGWRDTVGDTVWTVRFEPVLFRRCPRLPLGRLREKNPPAENRWNPRRLALSENAGKTAMPKGARKCRKRQIGS